jgi:hypothetical protein
LANVETSAKTPQSLRLQVRSLGPISVSGDGAGGLANVAGFTFMIALTLWMGLVVVAFNVARNVRAAARVRDARVQVLNAPPVGSETGYSGDSIRRTLPTTVTSAPHRATATELAEGARRQWN